MISSHLVWLNFFFRERIDIEIDEFRRMSHDRRMLEYLEMGHRSNTERKCMKIGEFTDLINSCNLMLKHHPAAQKEEHKPVFRITFKMLILLLSAVLISGVNLF